MKKAPIPSFENERICAVQALNILDSATEERFDKITKEAVKSLNVPISTITIVDSDREWFKSFEGVTVREGARDISFCGHAMLAENVFIIEDTLKDERFSDNLMVVNEPFIRFYAGIAIREKKTRLPIGVFCVKDIKPRKLSSTEIAIFLDLAERAEEELNKK